MWKPVNPTKIISVSSAAYHFTMVAIRGIWERDTQYYYQQYRDAGLSKKKFHGVNLSELDDLEKLYEVNIQVYSLAPTQSHSEDEDNEENTPEIAATLLRRSHRHYSSTLYFGKRAFIWKIE